MPSFGRVYVWSGPAGGGFSDFHNWSPVFADQQPPSDNDLVIFNSGGAVSVDGQSGLVAEIDVVLGTTLIVQNNMEATGTISGVALMVDSGGAVIVGSGDQQIGVGAVDVIGFTGAGTVIVTAGGHMDDNGMVLGDRAGASGAVTLDGAGSILIVANNLPGQPNGELIVGNAGTGSLAVQNGASLGSSFATLGEQSGATGSATLEDATWSGGLITIGKAGSGSLSVLPGGVLNFVELAIGGGGLLTVSGTLGSAGAVLVSGVTMTGGTLDVTQGGIAAVGAASGPTGAVLVETGYNFTGIGTLNGNVVLNSLGVLAATATAPGFLALTGDISGTGTVEPLMTLDLNGAVTGGVSIAFTAPSVLQPGVLVLEVPTAEGGTISGFAAGNSIDIPGGSFTTALFTAGTLTDPGTLVLSGGTDAPLSLLVAGGYAPHDFLATSDVFGTTITLAPCFVTGTGIATNRGAVAVERLQAGMVVDATFAGPATVKWIGHRHVNCRNHPNPGKVAPVRVRAHAFGAGQPHRDLWLSPDHAVFIDGVLIPIHYLLNDATILQETRDDVTYWHVELDRHDVILAEGLPCESYLDTGNRGAFSNGGATVQLRPDFAMGIWRSSSCARLVLDGAELQAARSWLLERAERLGHARTSEPALRLLAGNRVLQPRAMRGGYRFDLGAEATGAVTLLSRSAVPAHMGDSSPDHRRLGVAVSGIALDGRSVPLGDARLRGRGWHDVETRWRWSDGSAELRVGDARELEITLLMTGVYWLDDRHRESRAA
jgi:collagen type I/II/III/V/XI/XXIV/XXVII alpha